MKIVHPYGTSRSKERDGKLRRVLIANSAPRAEREVTEFAASHNELVIAQWISTIDKIACKPTGDKKPTTAQQKFRDRLGEACWQRLLAGERLSWASDDEKQSLVDLWQFKTHPYKDGSEPTEPRVKGRWYGVFAGNCAPESADAAKIAEGIEEDLYSCEYRRGSNARLKTEGRIARRAKSIERNVFRKPEDAKGKAAPGWTDADIQDYIKAGDPVRKIRAEAAKAQGRVHLSLAGKVLFEHWGTVFRDRSGAVRSREDAKGDHPGMVALHDELRQVYRHLLKRTKKDTPENLKKNGQRKLPGLLPLDIHAALALSTRHRNNAELANLLRLGKIVHYSASEGGVDRTVTIQNHWPEDISGSRFWQSPGQAEIKRAEAFVRVWRQALVFARWTLTDWVSMKAGPFTKDILGGENRIDEALGRKNFDPEIFDRKLLLLFGSRKELFGLDSDDRRRQFLRGLTNGARNLRNAAFHFTGRGRLLDELGRLPGHLGEVALASAQELWSEDARGFSARLKADLKAAHVQKYLTQSQVKQVFTALAGVSAEDVPLPRFSRVLLRKKGAWGHLRLPDPANLGALEQKPARACQYTLLKLLYERPFRAWLKEVKAEKISVWIDKAIDRATKAAKRQNAHKNEVAERVIAAKA
ncbi:type VI-A CRISPR-associated RNA-guided ribonuclease Cas13a [Rhodomicrobium sp. Az07]|uniref:type VI-A CRISPR-associated RNA-guided ribonuclease Cas13a n=1 Tax=Rhodomicrobium sp. Az07 TaxID=2839034 RepID=UPI001BEB072E|nr:type VI-A CRISPR-associated RNA-guided ribonuclease Cas13a [Rhodomicrobium sp. Az07]MBT3070012.1 type VI-A CRISPR-associated RNA-guided ribonuclease Cas13a [Rhodomicrobium sp. Az07]